MERERMPKRDTADEDRKILWNSYVTSCLKLKRSWNRRSARNPGIRWCNQRIKRLFDSARNKRVRICNRGKWNQYYQVKNKQRHSTYPGLHNFMKSRFYPDTSSRFPDKNRKEQKWRPSTQKRTCKLYGKEHGSLVHKQIEYFTQRVRKNDSSACKLKYIDPCTIRILNVFEQKGWLPISSEFTIFDESLKVATSIDLLVLDTNNNQLILVELKTNYECESYFPLEQDEPLPAPLGMFKNCPLSRHMLQLAFMKLILEKKYDVVVDRSFIVLSRSKCKDVKLYDLSGWEKRANLLDTLYTEVAQF